MYIYIYLHNYAEAFANINWIQDLIRPALCFSMFSWGLKGLVIFNLPFTAELQEDNSAREDCTTSFSAIVYGASSVWQTVWGLGWDLPLEWQERKKFFKQPITKQTLSRDMTSDTQIWIIYILPPCLSHSGSRICLLHAKGQQFETGRANRMGSQHI